ncbi:hypothetical protein A2303_05510 [Candidatus Falkowbacteria bacterium RIFOXYB2_FULL_47_14]|uniref:Uncharacterized protein n=1 Tax=Candidatus Falkowbacteria bacterium RIFOXYA2_FULL_47_19 TaxID=1797994 RepID=A0A1F5SFJ3_9BACT|nr:MAG: hypothetical protein A2227_06915 [Candidatus Falkowbacteria bacterium RIFOXYA2_FULL_47_19]OGF35307.1 MAG: hypothetical protein A2468_00065 [Candidatus Falkowbacteria bacterium RIFOXYC2_FULL_46_15]OGF43744.1 MAG: hypothetical protein A2303_05510 [Candidatus Falkowbacteria bacterium RIFOXYB2_FULL_47_14]
MEKLRRIIEWTKLKIRIESNENDIVYFKEREIWWASLGSNIGFEQDGKNAKFERPVLILRKFGPEVFWGVPMSSKKKEGRFYYVVNYDDFDYSILLSQLRLISSKRLVRKLRYLPEDEFEETKKRIKDLL